MCALCVLVLVCLLMCVLSVCFVCADVCVFVCMCAPAVHREVVAERLSTDVSGCVVQGACSVCRMPAWQKQESRVLTTAPPLSMTGHVFPGRDKAGRASRDDYIQSLV